MRPGTLAPVCNHFDVCITILQIMEECPRYDQEHQAFHLLGELHGIPGDDCGNVSNVMAFLRSIRIGNFISLILFSSQV
jgi:hypothetical protein